MPADDNHGAAWRDFTYSSADGLALHGRSYGDPLWPHLPVVCLPGLTRSVRDFHDLATFLCAHRHRPRRVVAFDYRGRGGSEWDRDPDHYNPLTEMNDVFDGMASVGIDRAIVVGTSRGGIIAMLMGVARPTSLAGIVLNDIGPEIEPQGLARIKAYVGKTPEPTDWDEAVHILKKLHAARFTGLDEDEWRAFARMTFREVDGRPAGDSDPALARTLDGVEFDQDLPALWDEFAALKSVPILAIRGANSDLLSQNTLERMAASHPRFSAITVDGEGHPPLLRNGHLLQHISAFMTEAEDAGPPVDVVIPRGEPGFDADLPVGEAGSDQG